jgi:serine/threonine protein kinase
MGSSDYENLKHGYQDHPQPHFPPDRTVSDSAKDLLTKMLELNPEKRIEMKQVLAHPWLARKRLYPLPPSILNTTYKLL